MLYEVITGISVQIAGREFQTDFEPIIERQIHHLINYIQGVMHIGQRDISWIRISKAAIEKGFTLKDIGVVLHAKFHQDFQKIVDKVQVTLYTNRITSYNVCYTKLLRAPKGIWKS